MSLSQLRAISEAPTLFKASAPGSLMLAGEYAVLENFPALVFSIDKRITVTLNPRTDAKLNIHSNLGSYSTDLDALTPCEPFTYILAAIARYPLKCGCDIHIEAEFSSQLGLGSSAAVTVATLATLARWIEQKSEPMALLEKAITVIKQVQGQGSGADAAASIFGGLIQYWPKPLRVMALNNLPHITAVYSGAKTTTGQALHVMQIKRKQNPKYYQALYEEIGEMVHKASQAINQQDWQTLGQLINQGHGLQQRLGVSSQEIDAIVDELKREPSIYGAKISGSGLGDCIVALGSLAKIMFPHNSEQLRQGVKQLTLTISPRGLEIS